MTTNQMTHQPIQRLGVLGGTFDPVHYGHLLLAESAREQCRLDQVWLLPTAAAPHKQRQSTSTAHHRIEMLKLAIGGHPALHVSSLEVDRGGVSYTVDTLSIIREQHPDAELFFLMGGDSLEDLPHWRQPHRILELAIPVVVRRAGWPEPNYDALKHLVTPQRLASISQCQVVMPVIELASTEIRRRVGNRESIRYRTPRAVEKYIETHGLYQ